MSTWISPKPWCAGFNLGEMGLVEAARGGELHGMHVESLMKCRENVGRSIDTITCAHLVGETFTR